MYKIKINGPDNIKIKHKRSDVSIYTAMQLKYLTESVYVGRCFY